MSFHWMDCHGTNDVALDEVLVVWVIWEYQFNPIQPQPSTIFHCSVFYTRRNIPGSPMQIYGFWHLMWHWKPLPGQGEGSLEIGLGTTHWLQLQGTCSTASESLESSYCRAVWNKSSATAAAVNPVYIMPVYSSIRGCVWICNESNRQN